MLRNGANSKNDKKPTINEIINTEYTDLIVKREWHNIDMLCISEKGKLLVAIENKWASSESEKQLQSYYDAIATDTRFSELKWVFIYLTINGEHPKGSDKYDIFTHEQIYRILKSTTRINKKHMNKKVYDFINNYLCILEEQAMSDINPKLVELCKTLYKENKTAIDTIINLGKPRLSKENMSNFHHATNTHSCSDNDKITVYYGFVPNTWASIQGLATGNPSEKYRVFFSFNFTRLDRIDDKQIVLRLDIGDFPDRDNRNKFIDIIKANFKAKNIAVKNFTNRVVSVNIPIENNIADDYDKIIKKMIDVYKSSMASYESVLYEVMKNYPS